MKLRPIAPMNLPGIVTGLVKTKPPELRSAQPTSLFVDARYQRDLSQRSVRLIRKIAEEWDWRAFKPPVVVEAEGVLQVIDGQHTAIGAATRGIEQIPVLLIEASELDARANAFVRHNRDRIAVSRLEIHRAMVTAGEDTALTIDQVCERAGVNILKSKNDTGAYKPGETIALTAVRRLVERRYAIGARRVLEICAKSGAAPIAADMIKSVEMLVFEPEFTGEMSDEDIAKVLSASLSSLAQDSHDLAVRTHVPRWRAVATLIYSRRPRRAA